jgi:protein-arginine kinase activator protein McsA
MASEPKCMKCDNPATHKITKIVKGKVYDLFLCDEHAQIFSPYIKKSAPANLVEILHQLLKQQEQLLTEKGPICPNCGLAYGAYRKTLLLGCSDCYEAFEQLLVNDLRKMHGAISHYGAPEEEEETTFRPDMFSDTAAAVAPDDDATSENSQERDDFLGMDEQGLILSVDKLRLQLEDAVKKEDFERAVKLRDSIRLFASVQPKETVRCEKCGGHMQVMHGPKGFFMACSHFPGCRSIRPLEKKDTTEK